MKIIEPQVELWKQEPTLEGAWNQIARATRVCYQSKPREGESSEDFVKRIILKPALIEGSLDDLEHCEFNFDKMHGAMLEHGTVYLSFDVDNNSFIVKTLKENKYTKVFEHFASAESVVAEITTNVRVLIENNIINLLNYICKPTKYHIRRYTFSIITDIGVTREMNRHRTFSVAEQSTRYCDLTKDKFGNSLSFSLPSWISEDLLETSKITNSLLLDYNLLLYNCLLSDMSDDLNFVTTEDLNFKLTDGIDDWNDIDFYVYANLVAQYCYQALRHRGWRPEQARQVLPLGLKTQAIYTAFSDDWNHFLRLRADNVSGRVHPNMQLVAKKIKEIIETL